MMADNPIFVGADPHAYCFDGTIYVYPTSGASRQFFVYSSEDLQTWQSHQPILDFTEISWIPNDKCAWAPGIIEKNGTFYFYYSVGPKPSSIGVAYSQLPTGPFVDSGQAVLSDNDDPSFEAIDPMVFRDPISSKYYLYVGGSAGAKLRIFELNDDIKSISQEILATTPFNFTEGAFMHYRNGIYYLSYSHGQYRYDTYSVHYATSSTPLGPWNYKGAILVSNDDYKGPGHHSFLYNSEEDEWYIFYHRWENVEGSGPYSGSRVIAIDYLRYDEDGQIKPVIMTEKGIAIKHILTCSSYEEPIVKTFTNPLNPGPDPWMLYYNGNYYLTTSQGNCIRMWKAPTLSALKTTPAITVWKDDNPARSHGIWAPEFHFINNRWYLYYTAMAATKVDTTHRMHVLESAGKDPLGPYQYKGRLFDPANDQYAIDGSVFQHPGDGQWYFLWAAHPGHVIHIARMANPWTLATNGVVLPASGFGCQEVREGPAVLKRNGKLFLTYSACDTGKPDYKIGMLMADDTSDVLDPNSWRQYPEPVFERNDSAGVFGPGHHGFFRSPDGMEDWIVYHAKTNSQYTYRGRTTRAQKFTWNPDGTPNFGKPLSLDTVLEEPSKDADILSDELNREPVQ